MYLNISAEQTDKQNINDDTQTSRPSLMNKLHKCVQKGQGLFWSLQCNQLKQTN